jgi:nucleotide-binding universal stress UspA family protein
MRILLAVDGSESSLHARNLVAGLHWPAGSTVRLIHAYEMPIDWTGAMAGEAAWVAQEEELVRDRLRIELQRLAEALATTGLQLEMEIVKGRPATAILEDAREFMPDLIVMGSRGRGPMRSMLLGSVSAEVVNSAHWPVLIARGDRISRLLVATDGSTIAQGIPDVLGAWGVFQGLPAKVVSVAPPGEQTYELLATIYAVGSYPVPPVHGGELDEQRQFAEDAVRRLEAVGIPSQPLVTRGDAGHEIVEEADRAEADLIVTGSRGLGGLERLVLGSVARNVVLHARCSVLVMHGGAPAANARSPVAAGAGTAPARDA